MATIQVKEYELLPYHKPGLEGRSINRKQAECLKRVEKGLGANALEWQQNGVKFRQFCGVISLGKDSIEVLPKIHGIESIDEDKTGTSRNILIKMLAQAKQLKTAKSGATGIDIQKHQLLDVFIDSFCTELFRQLHQGMIKTYVTREDNLNVLKGRLMIKEQLRHNLVHKERFFCQFDELVEDNDYNQVIKATLRHLFDKVTNNKLKRKLTELLNVFDTVADKPKSAADVDKLARNRMVKRYDDTLTMCRMFLAGVSPDVVSGKHESLSLLFDMNKLFEDFIYKRVKKVATRMGLVARAQGPQQYLANCSVHERDMFKMMPDVTITDQSGNILMIIDTKWKLLDPQDPKYKVSQADMYQMHAYATQYRCDNIILLYPFHKDIGEKLPSLQIKNGNQRVSIQTVDICALTDKSQPSVDEQLKDLLERISMTTGACKL